MKNNLKQIKLGIACALVIFSKSQLIAEESLLTSRTASPIENVEEQENLTVFSKDEENQIACNSMQISEKTTCISSQRGVFDPANLKEDNYLWLDIEALYWQANVGGLNYGVESDSNTTIDHGRVKELHFDWNGGVRAGIGFRVPRDHWDVFINYTYVHATADAKASAPVNGAIYPTWATGFGFVGNSFYATEAKARWNADVNMGDIELGRTCLTGKWLTLRPFIGVRGLVIDQNYHLKYSGGTAFPNDQDKVQLDTDFWGVGVRMGLDSLWGLGRGFGIYGNGSVALLSGHFDVHENERLKQAGTRKIDVKRDVDNVVVTADLALGLQWDCMFSKDRYHLGFKMGWEYNVFFDQNQLFNFMSSTNPGAINFQDDDLSFQGITIGLRFDF